MTLAGSARFMQMPASPEGEFVGARMKFAYFHLMPYTASPERTQDWPVPNKRFDPRTGEKLYTAYIDNMAYAEECGFDWVGCNEHHMSPFGMMSNPNLIGASLIQRTKRVKIAMVGNSAEIAGEFGAMFGIAQLKTFEDARNLIEIYRESARAHGFDPKPEDVLVGLTLSIAEDAEEAKENLTNGRRFFADVLGGGIRTAQKLVLQETRYYDEEMKGKFVDVRKSAQVSVDDLLEQGTILCGTPEMVVDQLKRVHAVMGHGVTNINMKVGNVPDEIIYKGMDLFKERVLPHVRDL